MNIINSTRNLHVKEFINETISPDIKFVYIYKNHLDELLNYFLSQRYPGLSSDDYNSMGLYDLYYVCEYIHEDTVYSSVIQKDSDRVIFIDYDFIIEDNDIFLLNEDFNNFLDENGNILVFTSD